MLICILSCRYWVNVKKKNSWHPVIPISISCITSLNSWLVIISTLWKSGKIILVNNQGDTTCFHSFVLSSSTIQDSRCKFWLKLDHWMIPRWSNSNLKIFHRAFLNRNFFPRSEGKCNDEEWIVVTKWFVVKRCLRMIDIFSF